jgi:hypothetical protein
VDYKAQATTGNMELVPEGTYETVIVNAGLQPTTLKGIVLLSMRLTIRNDVQQPCPNRMIFWDVWPKKEPTEAEAAIGGFGFGMIQGISRSAKLPDGKAYPDIDAWIKDLIRKPIRVTIKHEARQKPDGSDGTRIKVTDWQETEHMPVRHTWAAAKTPGAAPAARNTAPAAPAAPATVPDDELPF